MYHNVCPGDLSLSEREAEIFEGPLAHYGKDATVELRHAGKGDCEYYVRR